jgi:hypothetical protein
MEIDLRHEPLVLTTLSFGAAAFLVLLVSWCFDRKADDDSPPAPPPYEAFYPLDTGTLPEAEEVVARGQVTDTTPQGRVAMAYDKDQEMFEYWCDTAAVHYKYLDTVARKWVIVHDRRDAYVNLYREALRGLENSNAKHKRFKERVNKFVWRGRFELATPPPPAPAAPPPRAVRFRDFKNNEGH